MRGTLTGVKRIVAASLLWGVLAPGTAIAAPGDIELVDRVPGPGGAQASGTSFVSPEGSVVSEDGCRIVFRSGATNLHPDDNDINQDIYVRDRCSDEMILVSRATGATGTKANQFASNAVISEYGGHVAFVSRATNLDAADTTNDTDIYIRNLSTDTTTLATNGITDNSISWLGLSADGRYLVFTTDANTSTTYATGGTDSNGTTDVIRRDLLLGTNELVSGTGLPLTSGNGASGRPDISGDGEWVVFESLATDIAGSGGPGYDIIERQMSSGNTTIVGRAGGGAGAFPDDDARSPSVSSDGATVSFTSAATNLDPADRSGLSVFVRDLHAETTTLASRPSGDLAPDTEEPVVPAAPSPAPLTTHGALVAFESTDDKIAPGIPPGSSDRQVAIRSLKASSTFIASRAKGETGEVADDSDSVNPSLSTDGRFIAFSSAASNLIPGVDAKAHVYLRELREPEKPPVEGKKAHVRPTEGKVKFKRPGKGKFKRLDDPQRLPIGTKFDTSKGKVELVSNYNGERHAFTYWKGRFKTTQKRGKKPVFQVKLLRPKCGGGKGRKGRAVVDDATTLAERGRRKRRRNRTWGKGKGKHRSKGKRGSGTVRGTKWLTTEACGKTIFKLKEGKLAIDDFSKRGKVDKVLKAPGKYVAKR